MKEIIPLVELLNGYQLKQIDILANEESSSPFTLLFREIVAGKVKTDADASALVYKTSPNSDRYRKFKSNFRRKLINNLFFISPEHPELNDYQKVILEVQKEWGALQILQSIGQLKPAADMAEKLLPKVIHYEITEIATSLIGAGKTH
jgi:hypothetical protein